MLSEANIQKVSSCLKHTNTRRNLTEDLPRDVIIIRHIFMNLFKLLKLTNFNKDHLYIFNQTYSLYFII